MNRQLERGRNILTCERKVALQITDYYPNEEMSSHHFWVQKVIFCLCKIVFQIRQDRQDMTPHSRVLCAHSLQFCYLVNLTGFRRVNKCTHLIKATLRGKFGILPCDLAPPTVSECDTTVVNTTFISVTKNSLTQTVKTCISKHVCNAVILPSHLHSAETSDSDNIQPIIRHCTITMI